MFKRSVHRASIAVGVFLTLNLWSSSRAAACMCEATTVEEQAVGADAVFLGEVELVSPLLRTWGTGTFPTEHRVNFRVIEAWKGLTGTQVGVRTGTGFGDCGARVAVGDQVLVYGFASEAGLYMFSCENVKDPSQVAAEQAELEQLGYEPLALTEGPDSQWPPYPTGACGLGVLPFLMMAMLGFACLWGLSPARG